MSLWSRLTGAAPVECSIDNCPPGTTADERDTISVIRDLSRVVKNNPDAVETYLALGSLFRAKGELERAVQIRESLLIRPELAPAFKARAYFELGQDYRRAGIMDRAIQAYAEAQRLGVSRKLIDAELATLYADSGQWAKAAQYYGQIGNPTAEAHYTVRQGEDLLASDPKDRGRVIRQAERALKIYPASPEAWSMMIIQQAKEDRWNTAGKSFQKALEAIAPARNFMLFEALLLVYSSPQEKAEAKDFHKLAAETFLPVIEKRKPELAPYFYGARLLRRGGRIEEAEQWLNKLLIVQPEFWAARLLQLEIAREQYGLPPTLDSDLEFFIGQSKKLKHFVCTACGLHRDILFYCCPRCHGWHSAAYKISLGD
ncbi:MAG: hypothetical protein LBV80_02515 [Deltaproteobacteria bacterium]|jgi:lipopolysaccharide biosynthesis regulator YciM|nr:hypothetical protein [Deltaproteobacteria bacterium]